ncbi:MAG: response regulator [Candidatus Eisenbacteria bacterium]|nr:response regulator [Candidatus Eisenbacteria bacterium]
MENLRAFIVDDDSSVRRILVRNFERAGFTVATASNGQEALEKIRRDELYDILISDLHMPRMDGRRLCEALAEEKTHLPEFIFIVTSRAHEDERSWVERFDNIQLVEKPVGPRHLLRLVRRRLMVGVAGE